jgi:hypothetical protein
MLITNEIVDAAIAKNELRKIAICWVHGIPVPCRKLPRNAGVQRLALPTHPIVRESIYGEFGPQHKVHASVPLPDDISTDA